MPWVKKKTKDKEEPKEEQVTPAPKAAAVATPAVATAPEPALALGPTPAPPLPPAPAAAVPASPLLDLAPDKDKPEAKADDDLLSLFTEETAVNESLMMLTRLLSDVDINDLLEQTREVAELIHNRRR